MPNNKVDQKITDRSAKEFSDSIESGKLYEELKNKDSKEKDEEDKENSDKRRSK